MLNPSLSSAESRPAAPLGDTLIMVGRSLRLASRNLDVLLTALILPVMLMVLFVYLFGGAIDTGTTYVTYVVPGVLLLCAGYGASLTAVSVSQDLTGGIIDRFRSLDVSGAALLAGHVVASVLRNLISTVLVLGVALLIGFRPSAGPLEWLAAAGILLVYILALSWLSAVVGLLARSPEAASGFSFFFLFLPYPSSAFVPINSMPSWIQGFAQHQPVTPVTETIRGLLVGTPVGSNPWIALAWCGAILFVSVVLASILFPRRTA
ncbi:MAG TPA: ABC transporter permease [Ktedonobacterales bacterium]|nr:ABC transporter permease [Ktedonobacterales bacterium]